MTRATPVSIGYCFCVISFSVQHYSPIWCLVDNKFDFSIFNGGDSDKTQIIVTMSCTIFSVLFLSAAKTTTISISNGSDALRNLSHRNTH